MVLKRDVIILIYYMSNGLIFEIVNGFYEIFRDIRILLKNNFLKKFENENRLIIDG